MPHRSPNYPSSHRLLPPAGGGDTLCVPASTAFTLPEPGTRASAQFFYLNEG